MIRRGLRLEIVAGLGFALAMPALALAAEGSQGSATETTLAAETHDQGGRTQATFAVTVTGENGLPAGGAVVVEDHGRQLAGAALNAEGHATMVLALPGGDHLLRAVYAGDATHEGSVSQFTGVHALVSSGTPDFQVSVAPATISLTAGNSGTATVTISPENNSTLSAPMFVTLSCTGLPDQSSCVFTPENVQILASTPVACTTVAPIVCPPSSSMVLQTQAASTVLATPPSRQGSNPVAWAFLLPGALALVGLAWGGRHRRWLSRLSLVALVGLVSVLGATACNPRYYYLNHGPPKNPATPAGTFTVSVIAQSSNGVTATTHSTTFVLTVK